MKCVLGEASRRSVWSSFTLAAALLTVGCGNSNVREMDPAVVSESLLRVTDSLCASADHCGVVAMKDDLLVVGMPWADARRGAVLVYRRTTTGWLLQTRLTPADDTLAGEFGATVATEAQMIFVGVPSKGRGEVVVFDAAEGPVSLAVTLLPGEEDGAEDAAFGTGLAVSDGMLAVGAPAKAGAAYVFVRGHDAATWTLDARFMGSKADAAQDRFGQAVAVDGDRLVVGAPGDSTAGAGSGAVYAYERRGDTWEERAFLKASEPVAKTAFGSAVALRDDLLVVGAPARLDAGAVYVFGMDLATWTEHAQLTADGNADRFGTSVAIGEGFIAVGAPGEATGADANAARGAVFTYSGTAHTEWTGTMMRSPDSTVGSLFGNYLASDGHDLAIGAPGVARDADTGVYVMAM